MWLLFLVAAQHIASSIVGQFRNGASGLANITALGGRGFFGLGGVQKFMANSSYFSPHTFFWPALTPSAPICFWPSRLADIALTGQELALQHCLFLVMSLRCCIPYFVSGLTFVHLTVRCHTALIMHQACETLDLSLHVVFGIAAPPLEQCSKKASLSVGPLLLHGLLSIRSALPYHLLCRPHFPILH